jgi:hypothetical protein
MNMAAWIGLLVTLAICGLIVGEAIASVIREEHQRRIRQERERYWNEGFEAGNALDEKTRRIGERASRLGR